MSWVTNRRSRVLLCTSGVSFMIMLDSNIVAVALPTIAQDLEAAFSSVEWVVSAYVLTFAVGLMPAGSLADHYGRKRFLMLGLVLFTVASVACGLAQTSWLLNWARALQGVGAAIQLSAALAVLGNEFRGIERVRAFGVWGAVLGVAVAAGPIVGGLATSYLSWRWAFLVNIPTGIILLTIATLDVEDSKDSDAVELDLAGMASFGSGLFFIVWGLIDVTSDGWSDSLTLMKLGLGLGLFIVFFLVERRQSRPMIDLDLFGNRSFLGSCVAMLGYAASAQVMVTYLPLYLQNAFHFQPASTGLAMLAYALPLFVFPTVGARLASRVSGRMLLTSGLTLVAGGNLVTGLMANAHMPYPPFALGMLLIGAGAGLLNGETVKVLMSAISPERGGMASGISASLRFVGIVIGFAGLGAILAGGAKSRYGELTKALIDTPRFEDGENLVTSRLVAGDVESLLRGLDLGRQDQFREIFRASFESGFAMLLLSAAVISGAAALLTYWLVCARATAPLHGSRESSPISGE
ncbi:Putative+multidrug+resistance+protein+MdtD [Methylocapsa aurea]